MGAAMVEAAALATAEVDSMEVARSVAVAMGAAAEDAVVAWAVVVADARGRVVWTVEAAWTVVARRENRRRRVADPHQVGGAGHADDLLAMISCLAVKV